MIAGVTDTLTTDQRLAIARGAFLFIAEEAVSLEGETSDTILIARSECFAVAQFTRRLIGDGDVKPEV